MFGDRVMGKHARYVYMAKKQVDIERREEK